MLIAEEQTLCMASIRKEILVDATPDQVWVAVRDVGMVHVRLILGHVVATRLEGDYRILTFPNGGTRPRTHCRY